MSLPTEWTTEQLEDILSMIEELDGSGLIVTDTDMLRESLGLEKEAKQDE